jgi:L-gulonolactone oxidase
VVADPDYRRVDACCAKGAVVTVVRNWARNQSCIPAEVVRPRSTGEVADVVRRARVEGRRVKVIGSGHSFTAAAMTNGVLLSLERMRRVVSIDTERSRVTVQAGITLHDLNEELAAVGLALPNLGDIDVQSVAGAINTATHGTGLAWGNLATMVVGMELVDGRGDVVRCDESAESEVWSVARVGVGALGVVTEVTLQCVPAFNLHAHETIEVFDDLLDDVTDGVPTFATSADHAEFFWMPGARRCQVKRNRRTDEPARPPSRFAYVRDKYVAENAAFGLVCRVGRRFPSLAPRVAKLVAGVASEREVIDRSDKVFASPRLVRFVEMEYGIPVEALPEALRRVRDLTTNLSYPTLFPVEVRVSAADDIALSTGFGRTSGWIAVHQYRGVPYEHYFQGVEAIMADYEGRPHWGKMHFMSAATLRTRYPEWDRFAEVRARLDPDGTFRNDYVDRVLGPIG